VPTEKLFSIPVYWSRLGGGTLDQVQAELKKVVDELPELGNPWDDTVQTNYSYTEQSSFLEKTPFFASVIAEEVINYLRESEVTFEVKRMHIKESWVNIYPKNAYQNYHLHAFSDISGCYYFQTNEKDGDIKFKCPSVVTRYAKLSAIPSVATHKPEVGKLLLFPSYLEHAVMANTTDHKRISVAFNVVIE
jgi:uncharacterized protein (TIGR02466 family)